MFVLFFRNPRVPCRTGILPGIDFSKWADYQYVSNLAGNLGK